MEYIVCVCRDRGIQDVCNSAKVDTAGLPEHFRKGGGRVKINGWSMCMMSLPSVANSILWICLPSEADAHFTLRPPPGSYLLCSIHIAWTADQRTIFEFD